MDETTERWLAGLERRHLANLMLPEVARALRALSSCYVERRSKLAEGGALSSAGKRAAFALFYGPHHFFLTRNIVRALPAAIVGISAISDVGCGTGAAGAAWAAESGARRMRGFDRHPWALSEAARTYRDFQLDAAVQRRDIGIPERAPRHGYHGKPGTAIVVAYAANELTDDGRAVLLADLLASHHRGARVLVIEPIARRALGWWSGWTTAFVAAGGREDEWRFPAALPPTQRALARAAGLDPRELTGRSLFV